MEKDKIKIRDGRVYKLVNGVWTRERFHTEYEVDPHDPDYAWLWDIENKK